MADERAIDPSLAPLLSAFSERLGAQLGLNFPPERWRELTRALTAAAPELGCGDLRDCLEQLQAGPLVAARQDVLAQHLTIGETYFFRDPAVFAALREHVLPALIRARSGAGDGGWLRVWSAGCSSGEEAYSLAITLLEALPQAADWRLTVLATDVNLRALAKARQGVYSEWSFRNTRPEFRARYFTRTEAGHFRIDPRVRDMVSFVPLNLVQDVYPAVQTNTTGMDLVFCRNVLMYLRPEQAAATVSRLERCLGDGGWLAVSSVEASLVSTPALHTRSYAGAMFFRKAPAWLGGDSDGAPLPAPPPVREEAARAPAARAGTMEQAAAHYAQQRYPEAVAILETFLADGPAHGDAMLLLARALANLGRLSDALVWCDRALAARPLDAARSYLRGSILLEQGQLEEAAVAFQRALYLDPDCALAHFALGNLLVRRGRMALAWRHYERARAILRQLPREHLLPEADGISAARMLEMIDAIGGMEAAA